MAHTLNKQMQVVGGNQLWQNYQSYILDDLVSDEWSDINATNISDKGLIVGTAKRNENEEYAVLLVPIDVYDDAINTSFLALNGSMLNLVQIQALQTVVDEAFIKENGTAWIKRHTDEDNDAPEMPRLVARAPIPGASNLTYKWRLEVSYQRPNGRVVEEDTVKIPLSGDWASVPGNEEWKIYEWKASGSDKADWEKEIEARGFFGGKAKLFLWTPNGKEPSDPVYEFIIGGENPVDDKCKDFIRTTANSLQPEMAWFAYAVARHESKDYNNGFRQQQKTRYNQFWENTGIYAKTEHYAGEVLWINNKNEPPPKGFGLFQVTGNSKNPKIDISRKELWNWQDNVRGGLKILASKRGVATRYFSYIQRQSQQHKAAYENCLPPKINVGSHVFSSEDAIQIYCNNGTGTKPDGTTATIRFRYPFSPSKSCGLGPNFRWNWQPHNISGNEPYINKVERELE